MVHVDVAVIGGGVTGLASALALAHAGASVCLLERERVRAGHQHAQLGRDSRRPLLSDRFAQGAAVRRRPRLALRLLRHASHPALALRQAGDRRRRHEVAVSKRCGQSHDNGVTSVELVDADFIKAKEPNVRAVAALWSPDTGILEAEALVKALEQLCQDAMSRSSSAAR